MGFIPIFVALLGASFLYTIYTVNKIRGILTSIQQAKKQFNQQIELLLQLASDQNIEDLHAVLKARSQQEFEGFEKESLWIKQFLDKLSSDANADELRQALKSVEELVYQLRGNIRDYNLYITESPTLWVARLWGFRKL